VGTTVEALEEGMVVLLEFCEDDEPDPAPAPSRGKPGLRLLVVEVDPLPIELELELVPPPPPPPGPEGEGVRLCFDDPGGDVPFLNLPPASPVAAPTTTFFLYPRRRHQIPMSPPLPARVSRYLSSLRRSNIPR